MIQVIAGAAAASSAAFLASYLGVTGTVIGAALASVVATVGTQMYSSSLHRSSAAVRRTATQFGGRPGYVEPTTTDRGPGETMVLPAPVRIAPEPGRGRPWARIVMTAAAVLAVTLGSITAVEAVAGKPLAALLGHSSATGTSLGAFGGRTTSTTSTPVPTTATVRSPEPTATPTAQPTATPTAQPTATSTATATPTDQPTATTPTATPTGSATGTPTAAPTS
jgi:hypothetical protein